jgi:H+/gluconate symporter-like permease
MSKKKKSIVPLVLLSAIVGIGVFTLVASFAATPESATDISTQEIQPSTELQQSVINAALKQ